MKKVSKYLGLLSLIMIALIPFAYFFDQISFSLMNSVLFGATLVWYATAFLWIGKPEAVELEMENDPLL